MSRNTDLKSTKPQNQLQPPLGDSENKPPFLRRDMDARCSQKTTLPPPSFLSRGQRIRKDSIPSLLNSGPVRKFPHLKQPHASTPSQRTDQKNIYKKQKRPPGR